MPSSKEYISKGTSIFVQFSHGMNYMIHDVNHMKGYVQVVCDSKWENKKENFKKASNHVKVKANKKKYGKNWLKSEKQRKQKKHARNAQLEESTVHNRVTYKKRSHTK